MKFKYKIKVVEDNKGNKTGIVLCFKDFEELMEDVEDAQDLQDVFKRANEKTIPYEEVMNRLLGNVAKK